MCETWSIVIKERRWIRVFEDRVLREIFGSKIDGVTVDGEEYTMRSFTICTAQQIVLGDHMKKNEMGGECSANMVSERCIGK